MSTEGAFVWTSYLIVTLLYREQQFDDYRMAMAQFARGVYNARFCSFVSHFWFTRLDEVVPGEGLLIALGKVGIDFVFFTPAWCASFLFGMQLLRGRSINSCVRQVRGPHLAQHLSRG